MPFRIKHPEFITVLEPTKYPFADDAPLTNEAGDIIFNETFLDASLYPIGNRERMYISKVTITNTDATITIGDVLVDELATSTFDILSPPSLLRFEDPFGRPAGIIKSEPLRLAIFQSWTVGEHTFEVGETEFVAAVCIPTPEVGVRGVQLDDGTILTGDVYIVADEGVVFSVRELTVDNGCGDIETFQVIRTDVVGDPLFRRRLCAPALFDSPQFLETITFKAGSDTIVCGPDDFGDIKITVGTQDSPDTILRVRSVTDGLTIEAVGERLENIG